ncbi:PP2C family protein-serine/threonine phosphatase [Pseudomonas nunensis]|uniref:PP2C family protein-serine/threonine phosphatase n=1 Tax=Pseudomonas nunensis TaxID=2961896 RepID=UPI0006B4443F|nr:serine/threonine protein phosphatase [Pseudomonas nunensis]KOY02282.1 serine/threonine protein phosphatase [Pseudomonas nunensis]
MIYTTRSVKGRAREDNRDCAGAMFDGDRGLFVIVDGTSKAGSGRLARGFVQRLMDTYQSRVGQGIGDETHELATQLIWSVLSDLHAPLFSELCGSTSYLVAVVANGLLTIAYEGDCGCGVIDARMRIEWITTPHCLANWKRDRTHRDLARDPARNRITRSYKIGKLPEPEIVVRAAQAGERLVFATDGFWADMSESLQAEALSSPEMDITGVDDDVTWIDVHL